MSCDKLNLTKKTIRDFDINKGLDADFLLQMKEDWHMNLVITFTIKKSESSSLVLYEAKEGSGITKSVAKKQVYVAIPASLNLKKGIYFHSLKIKTVSSEILGMTEGVLTVI